MHGDLDQKLRMKILQAFRDGELKLLIASDVAARGLDIPNVSHIFNFDVPIHSEDYVHRIGRTGRAGRWGKSFTLALPPDEKYLAKIEELVKKTIPVVPSPLGADEELAPARRRPERRAAAPRRAAGRGAGAGRRGADTAGRAPGAGAARRAHGRARGRPGARAGAGHGRPRPRLPAARVPGRARRRRPSRTSSEAAGRVPDAAAGRAGGGAAEAAAAVAQPPGRAGGLGGLNARSPGSPPLTSGGRSTAPACSRPSSGSLIERRGIARRSAGVSSAARVVAAQASSRRTEHAL